MKRYFFTLLISVFILSVLPGKYCNAQDTLRVMVYNTLHLGDGCQGTQQFLDAQLKTIVSYTNSDIIGLDKVQAIQLNNSDPYGISPPWFADSIISQALDAAFPGRYAYCTLTDYSQASDNDMSILFYNKNKLGFLSIKTLYVGAEDIDLYKLFYKDPNLSITLDSTFLYVVLCHTISGTSSTGRDGQATTVIDSLKKMFSHNPNIIYMGDFNTHNTSEPGYELITQTADTSFLFYDPPFYPDGKLVYPIDWTTYPTEAAAELTTTTRQSNSPNSCGNSGGGYDWFDHIFISSSLVNNFNNIQYIPNSWRSIGNDGKRTGISVNDNVTNGTNTSAPQNVLNTVFQFSDKYPVTAEFAVTYNTIATTVSNINQQEGIIRVVNPVKDILSVYFPSSMVGAKANMQLYDVCGRLVYSCSFAINSVQMEEGINLPAGAYMMRVQVGQYVSTNKIIKI